MAKRQFFFFWFSVCYRKAPSGLAFVRVQYRSVNAVGKGNSATEL